MGWDMNLEDRYREFVRLIHLATMALYVCRESVYRVGRKYRCDFISREKLSFFEPFSFELSHSLPVHINRFSDLH